MYLKTFVVFFTIHSISWIISLWAKQNDYYVISLAVIFIPLIICSIAWPIYLKLVLQSLFELKKVFISSLFSLIAIVLTNFSAYIFWYLMMTKNNNENIWSKDLEVARLILLANIGIFLFFYFLSVFLIKIKLVHRLD